MLPIQCSQSYLNLNNPRNYVPIKTLWQVQVKRGCIWVPAGVHESYGDLSAARHLRGNYSIVRVRASDTLGVSASKWRIFRFSKGE